ncbi:MAG TPA: DUF262 domain-containing protein [Candidatus Angelobacter sp.]|nr:DUF262 domain-containing protein [Candidatus Angelobacter sp.]
MSKTDISVRQLIDKVEHEELLLPEMQRRYVWPATRVRDLLDSLYREYPSGTILVWETDDDIEIKELAVKASKAPTGSQRLLLLDGQQRITSLAAILRAKQIEVRHRKKPIEILFNLEHPDGPPVQVLEVYESGTFDDVEDEEETPFDIQEELKNRTFVVASRALQSNPLWVPVSSIFKKKDSELLKPIGITSEDARWDKYSERLQRVRKIQEYQYVMQVLEKKLSYEEVTEIFVRVNSLGIKLRGSDLALAQITSRWKGFMAICEQFARNFDHDEAYLLDSGLLIRMLVVFATHQSRFKTVGRLSRETLKQAWQNAQTGIEFAINFVRSNAHVEDLNLLSSPFLLIPIAVYAHLNKGRVSPDAERNLLKWFYWAHMRGHYSGSAETVLDGDLAILFKTGSLDNLLKQLQQHVKQFELFYSDVEKRGIRNPLFSMLYLVLRQNGAKDWFSGISLSSKHVGKAHKLQFHHIFPKSLLKETSYEKNEINEIANIAFIGGKTNRHILNSPPAKYIPQEVIAKRGRDVLTAQLVPVDPSLWEIKNYQRFLEYRRKMIVSTVNTFMAQFETPRGKGAAG